VEPPGENRILPGKGVKMKIHRSSMEKILDQQENDTIITNPKQPIRTFFRKIQYLVALGIEKTKKVFKS
jgi:hypothetical protein